MNKKLTKVLALFLCIVMSLPLGAFASLGVFAENESEAAAESLYTEPTLTNTTDVAYFSYSGKDANSGLSASKMKKLIESAFPLLTNGGRLVIPVKGYAQADTVLPAVNGTVLITAKDTDGTLYFDPANPDINGTQTGMFMVAAPKTVTFQSDVIFDDVVILQRACSSVANAANIVISNNSTMVIGAGTQFHASSNAVCNSKLTVEAGSTLIVKGAGALSYNGAGTIYLDKSLVGNGIDASQFSNFLGKVYDLEGNALCEIVGHAYAPTVVDHEFRYVCGSCGADNGAVTYKMPELTNNTDVYYASNSAAPEAAEIEGITAIKSMNTLNDTANNGGTVYVTYKMYHNIAAFMFDLGGTTRFSAVLPDGTDLREQFSDGTPASQNGAIMWDGGKNTNFCDDVIFDKINFYSRSASSPILGVKNNATLYFGEVEFKRSVNSYQYTSIDIEAGSCVIISDKVSGRINSFTGYGTLVVDIAAVNNGVITAQNTADFKGTIMTLDCKEVCAFTGGHDFDENNMCEICGTVSGTVTKKFYVAGEATGDGSTPENPSHSIRLGFQQASADPIEIVLVDDLTVIKNGGIACVANQQNVTITSMDLDGDGVYPKLILQSFIVFYNAGYNNTITFKNIEIQSDREGTAPLFFDYNNFVIDEGVTCTLSGNYPEKAEYPTIYAGYLESSGEDTVEGKTNNYDTTALIRSGTWSEIIGGSRRAELEKTFGNNNGKLNITIAGGDILGNVSGTGSNFYTNDININVEGGTIGGSIYGVGDLGNYAGKAPYGQYGLKGDINIDVTGGSIGGGIYAKYPSTALAALIRGNVTVNLGDITLDDTLVVDLRATLAYAGKSEISELNYDESLYGYVTAKFVDVVNGEETGAGEPRRVAFVGDSITQGTGSTNRALYSAPANIQTRLNNESPDTYMVGNFGVGASGVFETAGYFYNDTLQYHLLMEEFEPEWVSFALGTNDCQTAGGSMGAALRFEELYYALIKGVHDLPTVQKVYVNTPIIRLDYLSAWSRNVSVIEPAVRKVVDKLNADGYNATLVEMGAISAAELLAGNVLGKDNLHPGDAGYVKMAEFYYDALFNGKVGVPDGYFLDTVYLSDNGTRTGTGATAEDPICDLPLALSRVNKAGGTIVIVDKYTTPTVIKSEVAKYAYGDFATPRNITGTLTIAGNTTDAVFEWTGQTITLGCDTVFDSITLKTVVDTPYINANFNSVTFTDTFNTASDSGYDITLIGGHYVQKSQELVDTTAINAYDTAAGISSDKDVTITIGGGSFANIMLLNRRYNASGPVGNYGGKMTVNLNGGKITGKSTETSAVVSGALTQTNLSGDITVNFNGTQLETTFYAITRTATLLNVSYDSALNTGSVTINGDAVTLDKVVENQRTNPADAQYAGIEKLYINSTSLVGDLDFDGEVSNADITLLVRYLSGYTTAGAKFTGDLTADKKVNNRDVIALIRRLNNAQ